MSEYAIAFRFARRELRGGLKGFGIFLGCLTLGVAIIAGVGSLSSAIVAGLQAEGQVLLGADVALRVNHQPATPEGIQYLEEHGGDTSASVQMRAMGIADNSRRTLVELKAVDDLYPLYGEMILKNGLDLHDAIAEQDGRYGSAIDTALAIRLQLATGDTLRVGQQTFEVRAIIETEPDRSTEGFTLGPRVMISSAAMAGTGLVLPGSLIDYIYRIRLSPETDLELWVEDLKEAFPEGTWRIRTRDNGTPGVQRFVERFSMFLSLVGMVALIVGGVGVGNAVKNYMDTKTETIATFKCLGASGSMIFKIYLTQIMLIAVVGILLGVTIGIFVPFGLNALLPDRLPVDALYGIYPAPLILAAAYGIVTAATFAIWPLAQAREVAAAGLFRSLIAPIRKLPRRGYLIALSVSVGLFIAMAVGLADQKFFASWFIVGSFGCFLFLRLMAQGVIASARQIPKPHDPGFRIALSNLHRPGSPTASVVLSMGLGLTLLVMVALIQENVVRQVNEQLPEIAPSFFFMDIQPDQIEGVKETVRSVESATEVESVAMLRGRVIYLNGVPVDEAEIDPESAWVVRGDRNLTYAKTLPENNSIIQGEWWPEDYDGPPLLSIGGDGRGLGLSIGDTVTVNILGREIVAEVANFRQIDWSGIGINFMMIFSPGIIEEAPHVHLATAHVDRDMEEEVMIRVTEKYPNVSIIRVKEVVEAANNLLEDLKMAIQAVASVTLLAGALVLAGALASGQKRRIYDAVMLKVLGATRRNILKAYLAEFSLLGFVAAMVGALAGTVGSWMVMTMVMDADWIFQPDVLLITVFGAVSFTVLLGLMGTWQTLGQKPAAILRAQ